VHAMGPPFPAPTKRFQRRLVPSTVDAAMAYEAPCTKDRIMPQPYTCVRLYTEVLFAWRR
jgi:hypothetical protein